MVQKNNDRGPRAIKPPTKGKSQLQDDSIQGTNSSSIVSKRSVERLYFPNEPHYFRYFVKKPQRRSPLINRGYWLRMKAVDHVVKQFLQTSSEKEKVVVNLGCGYDPLPWQCLSRYYAASSNVKFVDIDYRDLMLEKRYVVQNTHELVSMFTNVDNTAAGDVLFCSDQYIQLGCDLRDLPRLNDAFKSVIGTERTRILFIAEVSITYMSVETSDALINWTSTLPEAQFCLLEQILPDGIDHPFAKTMMGHFDKLSTPLGAVRNYPTTYTQEVRFKNLGWSSSSARNLWELWSDSDFLTLEERLSLDIEPFDEWEEFALFGCHYFLLVADNFKNGPSQPTAKLASATGEDKTLAPKPVQISLTFSENPKGQGFRRFGAAFSFGDSNAIANGAGNFGGMGMTSRNSTCDIFSAKEPASFQLRSTKLINSPSARMCHTMTDLGDASVLLVGGRTGPSNALLDCWLYHKGLGVWERVDDLPQPRYRHSAVYLGQGCVLVSPGRHNSQDIGADFFVWSRRFGWRTSSQEREPGATYGATFFVHGDPTDAKSRRGILAGGISEDGVLQRDVFEWEIKEFTDQKPRIVFSAAAEDFRTHKTIARFGAVVTSYNKHIVMIGGIIRGDILKGSSAVCILPKYDWTGKCPPTSLVLAQGAPRPLLIGSSIMAADFGIAIMGGSAVCFSFGTFWNKGCFTLNIEKTKLDDGRLKLEVLKHVWKFVRTLDFGIAAKSASGPTSEMTEPINVPRVKVQSAEHFKDIANANKPVILEAMNCGTCVERWTTGYLKEQIGSERQVVVHESTAEHMNFQSKNFSYVKKPFGEFIDQAENGARLYLRALSSEKPAELPTDITKDFPSIAADFKLPPELSLILENFHSSPLRISGPVIMWLHYDVMANVLCQLRGSKRLMLFPPSDVTQFRFEPGASSSTINIFDKLSVDMPSGVHPHEATLNPGDILFIPPLWLHTASPTSGLSISVNVFFRNFHSHYSPGKDVYGNRDMQVYEKGRKDIAKIIKSFEGLPNEIRDFYLHRLVQEFQQKAA